MKALVAIFGLLTSVCLPAYGQGGLTPGGERDFARVIGTSKPKFAPFANFGGKFASQPPADTFERVLLWNAVALEASAIGHTKPEGDPNLTFEQLGPHRASRATAMAHIAIFDASNAVFKKYKSFTNVPDASGEVSVDLAIAYAARGVLRDLYKQQAGKFDAILQAEEVRIKTMVSPTAATNGINLGLAVAKAVLDSRMGDGAEELDPEVKNVMLKTGAGYWSVDPVSKINVALGYHWGKVKPFVIAKIDDFALPPPPAVTSDLYKKAFDEVYALGGDGKTTHTTRTRDEAFKGVFWAYDGTANLCAPPNLYNQVAIQVEEQMRLQRKLTKDPADLARYLAIINVGMADAAIAAWKAKWEYQYWRPVTAIQYTGAGNHPHIVPNLSFMPLGAPASNGRGPNFTPPFPAYPSGHAVFGGLLFQTLREYWKPGPEEFTEAFSFVSDEFNGVTAPAGESVPRPRLPQSYLSFADAEYENGRSRIWLGIHWQFDADFGIRQGNSIASFVMKTSFLPR